MSKRDYYEVLGIAKNADGAEIKRAYRSLAMKYHPDRNPGDGQAAEAMKDLNEAYAVLCDAQKRRLYDTYGHAGLEGYSQADIFQGVDFESLFREGGLGDIFGFGGGAFGDLFGRGTSSRRGSRRGADLSYDLELTLEDVAFGSEKTLELPKLEKCPACNGTGARSGSLVQCPGCRGTGQIVREQRSGYNIFRQITVCGRCGGRGQIIKDPCPECEAKGVIEKTKEIVVKIPVGAGSGHQVRVPGEGEPGENLPGDLFVVLNVQKHPVFERHGDDIYARQDVPLTVAALGGNVLVPGLESELELGIPEGIQTGAVFRLTDKGIRHLDGRGRGDEYIIVKVVTPTDLSRQEKELLKQFAELRQRAGKDMPVDKS